MIQRWRCMICGYIHVGEMPPYVCPVCQAPQKMFELVEGDEGTIDTEDGQTDEEKR